MQAGLVIVWVWTLIAVVVAFIAAHVAVRFMLKARDYAKTQEKLTKLVEKRVRDKHNAIATLPPKELGDFLANLFGKMLELKSASQVSELDPVAEERLYAEATAALMKYLGPETIDAIDYYYGDNYINRWAESSYMLLIKRGIAKNIIQKETQYETTSRNLM